MPPRSRARSSELRRLGNPPMEEYMLLEYGVRTRNQRRLIEERRRIEQEEERPNQPLPPRSPSIASARSTENTVSPPPVNEYPQHTPPLDGHSQNIILSPSPPPPLDEPLPPLDGHLQNNISSLPLDEHHSPHHTPPPNNENTT